MRLGPRGAGLNGPVHHPTSTGLVAGTLATDRIKFLVGTAHVAYLAIMQRLRVHCPRLLPRPLEAFRLTSSPPKGGDLSGMLGLDDLLVETATGLDNRSWSRATIERAAERFIRVSAIDDPSLPRAVVFHDSFGTALIPLLAEHFSRAYFLRGDFNPGVVKRENPDVVIEIRCERLVMQPAPPISRQLLAAACEATDSLCRSSH